MPVLLATLHPYQLEFQGTITVVNEDGSVELDRTYFYPTGGGQPHDIGIIKCNDEEFIVKEVRKRDCYIVHFLDRRGLVQGDVVTCIIDKNRREKHRRMHTATHVLCAVIEQGENTKITGNQIGEEKTRIDFNIENYDQDKILKYVDKTNCIIAENRPIRRYVTTREELMKNPALVKLAAGFPAHVTDVHMVEIVDLDLQPCAGTHVDNTSEIGKIVFLSSESKGKNNRRVSFKIE
jgi:misacylated tRNA(Ala) deacylase